MLLNAIDRGFGRKAHRFLVRANFWSRFFVDRVGQRRKVALLEVVEKPPLLEEERHVLLSPYRIPDQGAYFCGTSVCGRYNLDEPCAPEVCRFC